MSVALITGGAIRIGRAIALRLAEAGFDIVLHYNGSVNEVEQTAKDIMALDRRVKTIRADLSRLQSGRDIIQDAAELGALQVLVNSAAIFPENDELDQDLGHWDSVMNINLRAPLLLSQAFADYSSDSTKPAHIVNILDARIKQPAGDHLIYRLSKSGLWHLTESLAKSLAPKVQVNGLALGAIMPPPGASDDHFQRMAQHIPLQKTGSPEDIAEAVNYLLGQTFITGAILPIDGGEFL